MTILKRVTRKVTIPGTPAVPPVPPWTEYIADPVVPPQTESRITSNFPWAGTRPGSAPGGLPQTGTSINAPNSEGGSLGSSSGDYYTATSLNGVPGTYILRARPDGSYTVIRV